MSELFSVGSPGTETVNIAEKGGHYLQLKIENRKVAGQHVRIIWDGEKQVKVR